VAESDYALSGRTLADEEKNLVLRKPQLIQAKARLASAQAQLEQAQDQLERTQVHAPFPALILEQHEHLGAMVSPQSPLLRISDSRAFRVEVPLTERDLHWLQPDPSHPDQRPLVMLSNESAWGKDRYRSGRLIGVEASVDPGSKLATALIEVDDPLALLPENHGKPRLLLGSMVRVRIEGSTLDHVIQLPRDYLRPGNQVWTVSEDNRMRFHQVDLVYSNAQWVLIASGLPTPAKVVTSHLSAPVEGMALRFPGMPAETPKTPGQSQTGSSAQSGKNSARPQAQ
jgi:RND family efflux transporter MFP subunit